MKKSKRSIFIITPVLKTTIVKIITNILLDTPPEGPFQVRILTKLNEEEFIDNKSDLEALEILSNLHLGPEFKLDFRGIENLNANVFIFDEKKAIVFSGGLSNQSLTTNLDYGIFIKDESLVKKILTDFDEYWNAADELKLPDLKYFIAQIQEHDTSAGGFLKLGTSVAPHGKDVEDIGPLEGETLAKKYYELARDHEDRGEYDEALNFFNKALVAMPNSVDILREKAVLLRDELKRENDALETLIKILSIEPKDEQASLEAGKILVKQHRYWDALIKLDITTSINPGSEVAWYWKSVILSKTPNRVNDALQCLDEVIKIDPNNEDAWFQKGKILSERLERYSEADRCFNTVTRINPSNEEAWINKGRNLIINLNKPLDAIKCFDRITKANKNSAPGWYYKGKLLAEVYKKNTEATRCFQEAVRINANYRDALYYLGNLYAGNLNDPENAKKHYMKLIELDANDDDALLELGLLFGKSFKDVNKATEYFQRSFNNRTPEEKPKDDSIVEPDVKFDRHAEVLKYLDSITLDNPENAMVWYQKGVLLDRHYSRYDDALKCFNEAIRLDEGLKEAWYDKGLILSSVHGKYDEAIQCLNKAISIDKNDENTWYTKGKALMDDERFEDALASFEKVLKLNPENIHAYENIANSLINLSRLKDAIEYFDKALKFDDLNTNLWYNKGNSLLSLRKYSDALSCYKKVLNINPSHELALKNFEIYSDKNNWV